MAGPDPSFYSPLDTPLPEHNHFQPHLILEMQTTALAAAVQQKTQHSELATFNRSLEDILPWRRRFRPDDDGLERLGGFFHDVTPL